MGQHSRFLLGHACRCFASRRNWPQQGTNAKPLRAYPHFDENGHQALVIAGARQEPPVFEEDWRFELSRDKQLPIRVQMIWEITEPRI